MSETPNKKDNSKLTADFEFAMALIKTSEITPNYKKLGDTLGWNAKKVSNKVYTFRKEHDWAASAVGKPAGGKRATDGDEAPTTPAKKTRVTKKAAKPKSPSAMQVESEVEEADEAGLEEC